MAIKSINPYLNFNGTAAQAIELYTSALGAKVESVMRFGDVEQMPCAESDKQRIMHASIDVGGHMLMLSDAMSTTTIPSGGNVSITLHFDDPEDMAKKFDALAVGGKVTMPLQDTFWGAKFGMLTDVFSVQWLFNWDKPKT